ncbi:MAG TPA: protein-L-isoaspartate(D-aspartate) O-methyltransferase [Calditrichia bacterium]|nr:protein-L-isoaspartate(D-aspartate) O-methyltransferase [Calditrichota bacterium]HQV33894.1 protein-L-isoaspartate(D-aspartate) O-methyltransferase [Calditrichia bacterium]
MYERSRAEMVEKYVIEQGVEDPRIIKAMLKIPRHEFVDQALAHQAYKGKSLPIAGGQTISHPTTVAWMTDLLELGGEERILEIGTGSGYQAAVLAEIGVKVFSIERLPELARRTQTLLERLGYYSVGIKIGDGTVGWNAHAPYDRIIVTAASPGVPENLFNQLKESGRMIIPVGEKSQQKLLIITKENNQVHILGDYNRSFVPLIGKEGWTL